MVYLYMASFEHTSPAVSAAVELVSDAARALLAALASETCASPSTIAAVEAAGRLVDAARIAATSPFSVVGAGEGLGFASNTAAVATSARISERAARERLLVATATAPDRSICGAPLPPRYPALAGALTAGEIGIDAAVLVARELDSVFTRIDAPKLHCAEELMVNLAAGFDWDRSHSLPPVSVDFVTPEIRMLTAAIDPDGVRPQEERAIRGRAFRIGSQDHDGLFPISGRLQPEIGVLLLGMIEATRRSPRFIDHDPAGMDSGSVDDLAATTDSRTPDQRRHDALAAIITAANATKDSPTLDGQPVTVLITTRADDLTADGHPGDPIGTMSGSTVPISRGQLDKFIDAGGYRIVTTHPNGSIASVSSVQRCFTPAQRMAIAARDGNRCATPGCTNSPFALQAHHVIPDRDGGPTNTNNGILLCWWHHNLVDTGPWHYRMVNGLPEVRGPGIPHWTPLRQHLTKAA